MGSLRSKAPRRAAGAWRGNGTAPRGLQGPQPTLRREAPLPARDQNFTGTSGASPFWISWTSVGLPFSQTSSMLRLGL